MSKNYYITTKDAAFMFDYMKDAEIDFENRRFEIHVAQTVGRLAPILQVHPEFSTWDELTGYLIGNEEHITIFDEYETKVSVAEFLGTIKCDKANNPSRRSVFKEMVYDERYYMDDRGYEWCKVEFS